MQSRRLRPERERRYPFLDPENYTVESPASADYNCAAWAAGVTDALWWPLSDFPEYYWPPGARRDDSLPAFVEGFGMLGYQVCESADLEPGFEKIAVYATRGDTPRHVARQLADGRWASKLGSGEDIEHETLLDVAGGSYGRPELFMRRTRPQPEPSPSHSGLPAPRRAVLFWPSGLLALLVRVFRRRPRV